jgi:hypothetical protein
VKAQLNKRRALPLAWVVTLLLLLGLGMPSFYDGSVGSSRIPVQTEQKYRLRNTAQCTFRVSFKLHNQSSRLPENSLSGIAVQHSINATLSWHTSKMHVLPLNVKLGSHQKISDYTEGVSIHPVG